MINNLERQWKKNGSWGMLMVTDDRIYFIIKAYEDEFGNWEIKEAVHLRTYQPSESPVDIISQFTTIVEGEAKSPMFYRICPGRNYVNFIIPSDEIKATYPLSEKQMKEVVDEQSKHGNEALNSGLSITEFTWILNRRKGIAMNKEKLKEWKKKGSYGMLLITEDEIYFCHEAFKTEFDDWDINKGIKLYDRIPRSFYNHTRQSEEMKKAAIEDLLKMGMTIDDDTYIGAFETTMPVVRSVSNLRILREYLQYTLPLSKDCMESILSMKGADPIKWDLHRLKV